MQLRSAELLGRGVRVRGQGDSVQHPYAAPTEPRPCGSMATHAMVPELTCIEAPEPARNTLACVTSVATLARLNAAGLDG